MPNKRRPKQGSHAYSPRKRAVSQTPRLDSWPEISEGPKLQGFAGYKAGMTHAFVVDFNKNSLTGGQEIQVPVTVLEVPPMKVAAVRVYENTRYGLRTAGEVWANGLDQSLARRLPIPKNQDLEKAWEELSKKDIDDVRVLTYTQPKMVTGVPKKVADLMRAAKWCCLVEKGGARDNGATWGLTVSAEPIRCPACDGRGSFTDERGLYDKPSTCSRCDGSGRVK